MNQFHTHLKLLKPALIIAQIIKYMLSKQSYMHHSNESFFWSVLNIVDEVCVALSISLPYKHLERPLDPVRLQHTIALSF